MAGRHVISGLTLSSFIFVILIHHASQNVRTKRSTLSTAPRILTQQGNLIFQTGNLCNITFKSSTGGFINVNGDELGSVIRKVNANKAAIAQMTTGTGSTAMPSNIASRLTALEQRLNNLQPTGQVQTTLTNLDSRIAAMENRLPSDLSSQLSNLGSRLNNLNPTGEVLNQLNLLRNSMQALSMRVQLLENSSTTNNLLSKVGTLEMNGGQSGGGSQGGGGQGRGRLRGLRRRVRQLEDQMTTLQQLLTRNECHSNPCRNGGTCSDTFNGYICHCPRQWQGVTCEADVNECATLSGTDMGCQNGATCVNSLGSFSCRCTSDWHGVRCTEKHDDCTGASASALCGHGTCINVQRTQPGQPKYQCICDAGWTKQGTDPSCTVDVNECDDNTPHCSRDPPVQCINVPGTFYCGSCPTGYSGNGYSCTDINECLANNGGCSVNPRVDCINTRGSRTCGSCPGGYQGNGVACSWVGICGTGNNGGCHSLATCSESPGISGRTCTCPSGYIGSGVGPQGCARSGSQTGSCSSSPCFNGGACQTAGSGYRCTCAAGYTGVQCQTNINECASNPCQNGGTCTDAVNRYTCRCSRSFTGTNCEEAQQSCGGYLRDESGSLQYPHDTGDTIQHGTSCAWVIVTTVDKILMVTFNSFSFENHTNCIYDFLEIHDGPMAASHMIGKYCGNSLPNGGSINSTHNQLYMWLYTDASVSSTGFNLTWRTADPTCGGNLIGANFGAISSPGYPGNYPHNRDCVWTIAVEPGNNIMLTFATLRLENHFNCSYDYLEIRDGELDTSTPVQRYCNTSTPEPFTTMGPYAWIKFHSDANMNDKGFHITYAAVSAGAQCGGRFNQAEGIVISPNYPNAYDHNGRCVWVITVHEGDNVNLTFTNFQLESGSTCRYDYVEVRNGGDETAPLLGKFCGSSVPAPMTSTSNVMMIKFSSDGSVRRSGFRAVWSTVCGGSYITPTGTLQSPFYPEAYPRSKECIYTISQPQGYVISLTFIAFHLEGNSGGSCSFDYVEVRNGLSQDSPSLGRFCGSQIPNAIESSQNYLWLKFKSDGSVQNTGFQATYTSTERGCGGTLTGSTGSFESPGHPNQYPHGANCTWLISAEPGLVVRLTFHSFSIESHRRCRYDYVQVFDNSTAVPGSSLGKYCGSTTPPTVTSTDNTLTVVFRSDNSIAHIGFSASYVALNASTLCGRELTEDVGVITSPNFPGYYPHQRECIWTIIVSQGMQIMLNFTVFQMESHPNCGYDYLEIRNGGYETSPLIGRYCGSTIDNIIVSHSNSMWLKFKTDTSSTGPGFQVFYDGTSTGCGADLTAATGSFTSPNHPLPYGHRAECFWTITVARGSKIQLSFTDFSLEGNSRCSYDYVQVRDGSSTSPELAKVCGTSTPENIMSTSNRMWIKFRTDYSVSSRGFFAFYNSICSSELTDWNGVIESPNFPNPYPHTRNCTWLIKTTRGNTINVTFSHFDIESHSSCAYDYLELRDGRNENADVIQRLCGTTLPAPLASTGRYLWIKFRSDISVARNGFRLEYITNGCGGYFTSETGTISTPGYPNQYPRNRECVWTISVNTGKRIELNITTFDLETSTNCRFDVLEVFGGADVTSPRIAQLCHKQLSPQILTTTGNLMFMRFKSDVSIHGTGFLATYRSLDGGCGGNYTTPSGTLLSANYPNNYPHNTDCQWLIAVDLSRTVVLTFEDFDVESGGSSCTYDYVAVYDGPDQNATQLMKYCGNSLPVPSVYQSTANAMFVRMRTDSSVSKRGFKASYKTGCGGSLSASQDGVIVSPNYPATYDRRHNCSWLIQAEQSSQHVTLIFTHMDVEQFIECRKDYVLVLDGDDENAPQIGRYCGISVPPPITSQGSSLFVKFVSDFSVQQTGFRATYTQLTSACGGTFTAQSGTLASPGYPNNYPHNTECVWNVNVSPGNRLAISFSVFSLEDHDTCNTDYLELREGDVSGRLLGRFCGSQININVTALNGLWMKFRSDNDGTAPGFVAQYTSLYGGDIVGNSGQLSSPLYPFQYPHGVDYVWTITGPTNTRIRISFAVLDIEAGRRCIFDYVRFRDGGLATSPMLGQYCGTTLPPTFYSTTNQISVEFRTDLSATGQGFLFNWAAVTTVPTTPSSRATTPPIPGCGGTIYLNDTIQTITSPGYPYGYSNNWNCLWSINSPQGTRISLNITDINLEGHRTCNYDRVVIYPDSAGLSTRLLGKFCGRTGNDEPIISFYNQMAVRFRTDYSVNRTGFSLDVKQTCGGRFIGVSTGQITSPGYPSQYPSNSNCTWVISALAGRTIRVSFSGWSIQSSSDCSSDYLQFLNGGSPTSPPLGNSNGRYCGSTTPSLPETSSNLLFIAFVTDGSGSSTGFQLTFNEVQVTCGGRLTLTNNVNSGILTSPNYPAVYPHNVECTWIITVPANERIQVDFLESFDLESSRSGCIYDYVEFREGGTVNSPQIARFCGTSMPGTVWSAGNVMFVKFRTDASVPKTGFKIQYKIATCGGTINGAEGMITSPNYPQNYDGRTTCEWMINAPTGHYITLTFSTFNLQSSSNCTDNDYVQIREYNSTGPVIMEACGYQRPAPVITSDSFAYIKFSSDNQINKPGFSLSFAASAEECGGDLRTPNGVITSPNYPGFYPHSRRCIWKITVARGRRIRLTFTNFNLQDSRYCRNDYVLIRNGYRYASPRLGYFCGGTMPAVVESSGNTMQILFGTDASTSNGGFRAEYNSDNEATCGADLTAPGNITSPGYFDGNYTNNLSCVWTIRKPLNVNSTILLEFSDLDLEKHYACRWDRVEIREGMDENGDLLSRFCGNETTSPPILSTSQKLWIWFKTDFSIVARGFFLTYSFKNCGGVFTQAQGIITSPNYPANYDNNAACLWQILAPEGSQIVIQYTNFNTENFTNCDHDYVEIFNGKFASSPSTGKVCGNSLPTQFKSGSNNLRIVFRSDNAVTRSGFRLTYRFATAGCGGLFHGNSGYLMSPNYPRSYPHNTECIWDIRVPNGFHVDLVFNPPFDLEAGGSCASDYVQVSDMAPNGTAISASKWCANENPLMQSTSSTRMVVKFRSDPSTNGNGFSANWTAQCGGELMFDSGILLSPNFPNNYKNNMECNYTILQNPQTYVSLIFDPDNFDLERGSRCQFDYVEIYSGIDTTGRKLGRYCGNTAPQPISALGSLFVKFRTDRSLVSSGFRATYNTSECGGNYTDESGVIQTPTHPNRYHDNSNCTWLITVQNNRAVWLKFLAFDLEAHSSCRYDYVDIYDGADTSAPKIGHYCGNVLPENIKTRGNQMFINFVTDSSVRRGGFRAAYETTYGILQGCGGTLNGTSGTFSSIDGNNDGNYENNLDCAWTIMVGDNKVIELTIGNMNIESSGTSCNFDKLVIYDGISRNSPVLGQYCGTNSPSLITTVSNVLYVTFTSDDRNTRSGFTASYRQIDARCGGTRIATETPQTLSSPNYPNSPSSPMSCRWTIDSGDPGKQLLFTMTGISLPQGSNCPNDYVEYRDFPMVPSGQSIHFCGTSIPQSWVSVGRTAQVNFAYATQGGRRSFSMKYQIASCNRTYTGDSGVIFSPGWPGRYSNHENCEFSVSAPTGTLLSFYFNFLHVEPHSRCRFDYLEIFNGSDTSAGSLAKLCGHTTPNPIFTTSSTIVMRFVTDVSVRWPGYSITYTASYTDTPGCGGNITGVNGTVTSPLFPGVYNDSITCVWLITVPARRRLTLTFADLTLIGTGNCPLSYMAVYDGSSERDSLIGRYCGDETAAPRQTTGNTALVKFVSDGQNTPPGFRLTFTS